MPNQRCHRQTTANSNGRHQPPAPFPTNLASALLSALDPKAPAHYWASLASTLYNLQHFKPLKTFLLNHAHPKPHNHPPTPHPHHHPPLCRFWLRGQCRKYPCHFTPFPRVCGANHKRLPFPSTHQPEPKPIPSTYPSYITSSYPILTKTGSKHPRSKPPTNTQSVQIPPSIPRSRHPSSTPPNNSPLAGEVVLPFRPINPRMLRGYVPHIHLTEKKNTKSQRLINHPQTGPTPWASPPMKIATWNVRGSNGGPQHQAIAHTLLHYQLDVLCLLEPKKLHQVGAHFSTRHRVAHATPTLSHSLLASPACQVHVLHETPQALTCPIAKNGEMLTLSFIHAQCSTVARRQLWDYLAHLVVMHPKHILVGDFNVIRGPLNPHSGATTRSELPRISMNLSPPMNWLTRKFMGNNSLGGAEICSKNYSDA